MLCLFKLDWKGELLTMLKKCCFLPVDVLDALHVISGLQETAFPPVSADGPAPEALAYEGDIKNYASYSEKYVSGSVRCQATPPLAPSRSFGGTDKASKMSTNVLQMFCQFPDTGVKVQARQLS